MATYNADIRIGVVGKAQLNQLEAQFKRINKQANQLQRSLKLKGLNQRLNLDTRAATTAIRDLEARIQRLGRTVTVKLNTRQQQAAAGGSGGTAVGIAAGNNNQATAQQAATLSKLSTSAREARQTSKELTAALDAQRVATDKLEASKKKLQQALRTNQQAQAGFAEKGKTVKQSLANSANAIQINTNYLRKYQAALRDAGREVVSLQGKLNSLSEAQQRAARRQATFGQARRGALAGGGVSALGIPGVGSIASGALAGGAVGGAPGAIAGAAAAALTTLGTATATYASEAAKAAAETGLLNTALASIAGPDTQRAKQLISEISQEFVVSIPQATAEFTKLAAAAQANGTSIEETAEVYKGLAAANVALGGNAERLQGILLATTQVFSKGKVQAEELRGQIGERLPGAFALFAQSLGLSTKELDKALEQGKVSTEDFVKFAIGLYERYGDAAALINESPEAAGRRLEVALKNLQVSVGNLLKPIGAAFQKVFGDIVIAITKASDALAKFLGVGLENAIAKAERDIEAARVKLGTSDNPFRNDGGVTDRRSRAAAERQLREAEARLARLRQQQQDQPVVDPIKPLTQTSVEELSESDRKAKERLETDRRLAAVRRDSAQALLELENQRNFLSDYEYEKRKLILEGQQKAYEAVVKIKDQEQLTAELLRIQADINRELVDLENERVRALGEQKDAVNERMLALNNEIKVIRERDPLQKEYLKIEQEIARLRREGVPEQQLLVLRDRLRLRAEELNLAKEIARVEQLQADALNAVGDAARNVFETMIFGSEKLEDTLGNVARQLASILLQTGLKALGGGDGVGLFSILGGDFGGGRASGGPVRKGTSYVVGEKGPELFVPQSSGTVVPNGAMGGVNSVVNVTINGDNEETDATRSSELGRMIEASVVGVINRERRPGGLLTR